MATNCKCACFVKISHLKLRVVGVGCDAAICPIRCREREQPAARGSLADALQPAYTKGLYFWLCLISRPFSTPRLARETLAQVPLDLVWAKYVYSSGGVRVGRFQNPCSLSLLE